MANTLSTEAPTDFGVNFEGAVEKRCNPKKPVFAWNSTAHNQQLITF